VAETIDWPPSGSSRSPRAPQRRLRWLILALVAVLLLSGTTALSYYVDALWFDSLGYAAVFWKTLNLQAGIFSGFTLVTFLLLYLSFVAIKPPRLGELTGFPILINGQPIRLPVEPVLRLIALAGAALIAIVTGLSMTAEWPTLALYWVGSAAGGAPASAVDPIFERPITFYLFTLPAWQLLVGWLMTLAIIVCGVALFFIVVTGGTRILTRGRSDNGIGAWRGLSIAFAVLLLVLAAWMYLGRYDRLFDDHTIFAGVTYTDAHVTLAGTLVVCAALVVGALMALVNAVAAPRLRWLLASVVPAALSYIVVGVIGWYVGLFIVKPNELVRERPYIANNIEMTRRAYGLNRIAQHPFPAETGIEAVDAAHNQETLKNIRLWDWRALQDTLRQFRRSALTTISPTSTSIATRPTVPFGR
jgi:uncharacterized membrane protein (UPF0182 family)